MNNDCVADQHVTIITELLDVSERTSKVLKERDFWLEQLKNRKTKGEVVSELSLEQLEGLLRAAETELLALERRFICVVSAALVYARREPAVNEPMAGMEEEASLPAERRVCRSPRCAS